MRSQCQPNLSISYMPRYAVRAFIDSTGPSCVEAQEERDESFISNIELSEMWWLFLQTLGTHKR
jgi:hypothetical protein